MGAIKAEKISEYGNTHGRAYYEELIADSVTAYYTAIGITTVQDICKASNNGFVACMEYCKRQCVQRSDFIKIEKHSTGFNTVHNEVWDWERLGMLFDIYVLLCQRYDKIVSEPGFTALSGVDHRAIYDNDVTSSGRNTQQKDSIRQRLKMARENSIQNRIADGKGTVGGLGILNYEYGYNKPTFAEIPTKDSKCNTAAFLPVFDQEILEEQHHEGLPDFE